MKRKYQSIKEFELRGMLSGSSQGAYGVVINAIRKLDGKEFVMKLFGYTKNKPDISWILREIDNMRALEGIEGVAQIEATFMDSAEGYIQRKIYKKRYPIIVMEKLAGGDLFDRIVAKNYFSERDASLIFRTFMTALTHIHNDRNMINIDLKTENLVFTGNSDDTAIVKIIDFGMAVSLWDRQEHYEDKIVGTLAFLAPETYVYHERFGQAVYSRASDIWQAGCILFLILVAKYPFGSESTHNTIQLVHNIKNIQYTFHGVELSDEVQDLFQKMFVKDPNKRITGKQILQHPWIVNNTSLPQTDLGDIYKNRLKNWACRKRFRRLLNRNILGNRSRQTALLAVLNNTHTTNNFNKHNGIVTNGVSCIEKSPIVNVRAYMTRSDTFDDYEVKLSNTSSVPPFSNLPSPQLDPHVADTSMSPSSNMSNNVNFSTSFCIKKETIKALQNAFYEYSYGKLMNPNICTIPTSSSNASLNLLSDDYIPKNGYSEQSSTVSTPTRIKSAINTTMNTSNLFDDQKKKCNTPITPKSVNPITSISDDITTSVSHTSCVNTTNTFGNNTLLSSSPSFSNLNIDQIKDTPLMAPIQHMYVNYESFYTINQAANITNLTSEDIFNIFDWNNDHMIDYLEFLLTLSTFRNDLDWNDSNQVATLYYDIFDMHDRNSISVDVVAVVLNKLFAMSDISMDMSSIILEESYHHHHTTANNTTTHTTANTTTTTTTTTTSSASYMNSKLGTNVTTTTTNSNSTTRQYLTSSSDKKNILGQFSTENYLSEETETDESLEVSNMIYDVIKSLDTDGDGEISLEEFQSFFNMIKRLQTLSIR